MNRAIASSAARQMFLLPFQISSSWRIRNMCEFEVVANCTNFNCRINERLPSNVLRKHL